MSACVFPGAPRSRDWCAREAGACVPKSGQPCDGPCIFGVDPARERIQIARNLDAMPFTLSLDETERRLLMVTLNEYLNEGAGLNRGDRMLRDHPTTREVVQIIIKRLDGDVGPGPHPG